MYFFVSVEVIFLAAFINQFVELNENRSCLYKWISRGCWKQDIVASPNHFLKTINSDSSRNLFQRQLDLESSLKIGLFLEADEKTFRKLFLAVDFD
jgi:hypothetical protein